MFSSDGSLLTESSTLRSSGSTVVNFSSGQVNVSSSCKVTGSFFTNVDVTILLTDGQMDVNKSVIDRSENLASDKERITLEQ